MGLWRPSAVVTSWRPRRSQSRALANSLARRFAEAAPDSYPAVHHLTAGLRAAYASRGDPDGVSLWAGTRFLDDREETTASAVARLSHWSGLGSMMTNSAAAGTRTECLPPDHDHRRDVYRH